MDDNEIVYLYNFNIFIAFKMYLHIYMQNQIISGCVVD